MQSHLFPGIPSQASRRPYDLKTTRLLFGAKKNVQLRLLWYYSRAVSEGGMAVGDILPTLWNKRRKYRLCIFIAEAMSAEPRVFNSGNQTIYIIDLRHCKPESWIHACVCVRRNIKKSHMHNLSQTTTTTPSPPTTTTTTLPLSHQPPPSHHYHHPPPSILPHITRGFITWYYCRRIRKRKKKKHRTNKQQLWPNKPATIIYLDRKR